MVDKKQNSSGFNENDLNFITGGAKVDENIDRKYLETFNTQRCNCNSFEPMFSNCSIDICDNCKWARATKENAVQTFCTKQLQTKSKF